MRTAAVEDAITRTPDDLLSTGEVAMILGSSRQHVVDLCERGDLPYVSTGTHRRIRRSDVDALRSRTERLTRDQRRSMWLGYAIAGKVAADPQRALSMARGNLQRLLEAHPRGGAAVRLREWERILEGPVSGVLEVLTSRSPRARELRQNTPFAGILAEDERIAVLEAFRWAEEGAR